MCSTTLDNEPDVITVTYGRQSPISIRQREPSIPGRAAHDPHVPAMANAFCSQRAPASRTNQRHCPRPNEYLADKCLIVDTKIGNQILQMTVHARARYLRLCWARATT